VGTAEGSFQRAEQREVFQPVRVQAAELLEIGLQIAAGAGLVVGPRNVEQVVLKGDYDVVVDECFLEGMAIAVANAEQLVPDQEVGTDQQPVCGKR